MKSKIKLSVILCAQNSQHYIKKTVESILNQTFKNYELLVIINCSNDKTKNIVEQFDDSRIHVYETKIAQLSFNLNYALNLAQGEYIARIDADDIAVPERFEKQLKVMDEFGYDVVGSNIDYIDENDSALKSVLYPESNDQIRRQICFRSVLAHPSVMIRKDILLSVSGYLGGLYAQDYDLWLRLMRNREIKFYNIQESLLKYRIHSSQTKGNRNSYAEVSGYFLKESVYSKRPIYILSAVLYYFKSLLC